MDNLISFDDSPTIAHPTGEPPSNKDYLQTTKSLLDDREDMGDSSQPLQPNKPDPKSPSGKKK